MSDHEEIQRNQSLEPLHELATDLVQQMGESPEQRIDWLINQNGETFGRLLTDINGTARGLTKEEHEFDGEGVQAGVAGGSIPPDQEDKVSLLSELVKSSQTHAEIRLEQGVDAQTVMTELAVAIPTVVNKLHLFADGNGRTSRMLRMVLRDGDQITPEKVDAIVNKIGFERYDTTPAGPVERAINRAMRRENGTSDYSVKDDVIEDDFIEDDFTDDGLDKVFEEQIPGIDGRIVKAYRDSFNFGETIRLIAKSKGLTEKVSLKSILQTTTDQEGLQNFIETYRGVRRQRVELLIQGLLDVKKIPLPEDKEGRALNRWVNHARKGTGLNIVDSGAITTVQDFQMAYEETFSPQRTT